MADVFESVRTPQAPRALRAQVLLACRLAEPEPRHWIDRLWESSGLRASWAGLAFALLAAFLAVEGAYSRAEPTFTARVPTFESPPSLFGAAASGPRVFGEDRIALGD